MADSYLIGAREFASATDDQLRINAENVFADGVYFGDSVIKTDGGVQIGTDGAVASISQNGVMFGVDVYPSTANGSLGL